MLSFLHLPTGHLSHYETSTHPTLKSMLFTPEQKSDFIILIFFLEGVGGGGGGGEGGGI